MTQPTQGARTYVEIADLERAEAWWRALPRAEKVAAASDGGRRRLTPLEHGRAAARSDGPATMHDAAASLTPGKLSSQRADVVFALAAAGQRGLADFELEQELGWLHQTASARRKGLLDDRWVTWTGSKVLNPDTGRSANLYALTSEARQALGMEPRS